MFYIRYKPEGINDFHNRYYHGGNIRLRITGTEVNDGNAWLYAITRNQFKRIKRFYCGVFDCKCPAGGVTQIDEEGTVFGIKKEWCEEGM
jgi:hypothetical protein